jgi:hypothetical protein
MGLLDFPDPVSIFEGAKTSGLERDVINSLMSAAYSSWITFMWRSGDSKWGAFTGEGPALKDAATSAYLSLRELEKKGFLTLTVPQDLLEPDNLSRFQTESKEK